MEAGVGFFEDQSSSSLDHIGSAGPSHPCPPGKRAGACFPGGASSHGSEGQVSRATEGRWEGSCSTLGSQKAPEEPV